MKFETSLDIDFHPNGNASQFLKRGWSLQEPMGIWSIGVESELEWPALAAGAYVIELSMWPMIAIPHVASQTLSLHLNGCPLLTLEFDRTDMARIEVPVAEGIVSSDGLNRLVLHHPHATAPSSVATLSGDTRPLAFLFAHIRIAKIDADDPNMKSGLHEGRPYLILCHWSPITQEIGAILEAFQPFEAVCELRFVREDTAWNEHVRALSRADLGRLYALWEEVEDGTAVAGNRRGERANAALFRQDPEACCNLSLAVTGPRSQEPAGAPLFIQWAATRTPISPPCLWWARVRPTTNYATDICSLPRA